LQIEGDQIDEESFDKEMLEGDIKNYRELVK
jgi:hypothetical protein